MRVLTYNILVGGGERLPALLEVIRAQAPDVVALQEAGDERQVARLAEALGMAYAFGDSPTTYHVAWLSRLPILRAANHRRPIFRKTLLEIEVAWGALRPRLFTAHLTPKVAGEERRAHEVAALLDLLGDAGDDPTLLAGDMNALAPGDRYTPEGPVTPETAIWAPLAYAAPRLALPPLLAAGFVDCYRAAHPDRPGYTFRTGNLSVRIDYIFASPPLAARLAACEVVMTPGAGVASDHFPVLAEFQP